MLAAVEANPDVPITLRCNAGSIFGYQDPGAEEDTPEGADYNMKRDLDVLQKIDLAPGSTLPARVLFKRLWERIPTVEGICGYDTVTSDAWRGCVKAKGGGTTKRDTPRESPPLSPQGTRRRWCRRRRDRAKPCALQRE